MSEAESGLIAFDKKKKKKKPTEENTENPANPEENIEDEGAAEGGEGEVKKKKKKKKPVDDGGEAAPADDQPAAPAEEENLDLGALPTKKKKKKKVDAEDNIDDAMIDEKPTADADGEEGDGEKKKKKKKKKKEGAEDGNEENEENAPPPTDESQEPWIGSERDYTYEELTRRIYRVLEMNNPEFGDKKAIRMTQPDVRFHGAKKTIFSNFVDICKSMHRSTEHFLSFLLAELGTEGSIDGSQRLLLKGRFQAKSVENIMKRYMTEYVICQGCKGSDSTLSKDNRLYFVQCDTCGARRSVAAISKGFQAQIGRRKDNKAK